MRPVQIQIPVRYQETDMMGVVYHANYLVYLEMARTELIHSLGFSYKQMEDAGYVSPVVNVNMNYIRSVTYGDTVTVSIVIAAYSKLKTVYRYELHDQNGALVAKAETTHVVVEKGEFRPVRLDRAFPEWHRAYSELVHAYV